MKRENFINILKCICIILVMQIHFSCTGIGQDYQNFFSIYTIKQWVINIQSIAVPLFFVINGYLILGKKRDEKYIIQKSLKLFLQLLFFSVLTRVIISIYNNVSIMEIDTSHFWFIKTLIAIYLLYPFLDYIVNNFKFSKYYLLLSLFVCFVIPDLSIILQFFNININLSIITDFYPLLYPIGTFSFYFVIVGLINKYKNVFNLSKIFYITIFLISSLFLLFDWYMLSFINGKTIYTVIALYNSIPVLLMTISIFCIFRDIGVNQHIGNAFNCIANQTLMIYYISWIIGYTVLPNILNMFNMKYCLILDIIKAIALTVLCSIISICLKKISLVKKFL